MARPATVELVPGVGDRPSVPEPNEGAGEAASPRDSCNSVPSPPAVLLRCQNCGADSPDSFSRKFHQYVRETSYGVPRSPRQIRCISCVDRIRIFSEREQKRVAGIKEYQCCDCRRSFPRDGINGLSKNQRRKNSSERRCPTCASISEGERAQILHQRLDSYRVFYICRGQLTMLAPHRSWECRALIHMSGSENFGTGPTSTRLYCGSCGKKYMTRYGMLFEATIRGVVYYWVAQFPPPELVARTADLPQHFSCLCRSCRPRSSSPP